MSLFLDRMGIKWLGGEGGGEGGGGERGGGGEVGGGVIMRRHSYVGLAETSRPTGRSLLIIPLASPL